MKFLILFVAFLLPLEALAQTTPTPIQKQNRSSNTPAATPKPSSLVARPGVRVVSLSWQQFKGATRCEIPGGSNTMTCDNGLRVTMR